MHQVGLSLHDYIEMHGHKNIKNKVIYDCKKSGYAADMALSKILFQNVS